MSFAEWCKLLSKYRWNCGVMVLFCVWSSVLYAQDGVVFSERGVVRYVREGGSGTGDGSSWENASGNLQEMISASNRGDTVYVAAGRYYALEQGAVVRDERGMVHERQKAFVMKAGVSVFGGFDAVHPEATPEERQWIAGKRYGWQLANQTVLSGGLPERGVADGWELDSVAWCWKPVGYMDNATHVVWFASGGFAEGGLAGEVSKANALEWEAVLDGFVIEGGNADGAGKDEQGASARFGGGVYLVGNGIVRNCIIQKNSAATRGGGVFMNYGGRVSDCYIGQNACPGFNQIRNGLGGGVYVAGAGTVERSFVVNNSARMGGGVYLARDRHEVPYGAVIEMSVVANNTAAQEAGGLYAGKAGIVTGTLVVANDCREAGVSGHGKTGGVYCEEYLVLTGSVVWRNVAVGDSYQGYAEGIIAGNEQSGEPASVQIAYSAVEHVSEEMFGQASLTGVIDIDDNQEIYRSGFLRPAEAAGILPHLASAERYVGAVDWDKENCSVMLLRGATEVEAPYVSVAEGKRIHIPLMTIDGKQIVRRPDMGPYVGKIPAVVPGNVGTTAVVYVDNQAKVCGSGESWSNPTRLLGPAINYLSEHGGGEVWVKEGDYQPVYSVSGESPQNYTLAMKGNVRVYGGFPQSVASPGMADRNPVAYRTIISGDLGRKEDLSDNTYHLVVFDTDIRAESVLDGFILRGANALLDKNNPTGEGGAVIVRSPYAVLRNCIIGNCLAGDGAAVWSAADFLMENCVVNNNEARMGAVVRVTTGTALVGLTVVMNVGDGIRGGKVSNTLAWGNTGRQMDGTASVAYSAASEMLTGMGNQLVDVSVEEAGRYFSNPTKVQGVIVGGYGTEVGTPAVFEPTCLLSSVVTRGSSAGSLSVDIRGVERGRGGGWDIGAFESTCLPSGDTVRYVRAGGTGRGLSWSDAAGDVQEMVDELYSRSGGQVWVAAGTYRHDGGSVSETVSTGLFGRTKITRYRHVNFVMREGVDVYGGFPADGSPGMSERQPMNVANRTILEPVELASNEKDDSKKEYKRGRVLEQQGDFTELTAWNGFTIQNGEISMDDTDDGGAGVKLMRNGLLENCYVTNNENKVTQRRSDGYWNSKNITLRGGGVNCLGGTLRNCYITENRATANTDGNDEAYGGGIYIKNGTVFNCVIVKNTCTGDYADGCAVFVEQADFYNNTISDNTGIKGTQSTAIRIGGFMEDSRLNVMNCIVWGNQVDYEILNENNKPNSITYSCFSGTVGGTNIAADPGFETGSYRLGVGSPCINAGNTYPESIVMPETDMDYTDRIKDCSVDIGAYEFGYNGTEPIHPWLSGDTARVCVTLYGAGMADGSSWENAVCRSKLQRAIDVLALRTEKVREIWVATGLPRGNDKHADVSADGFLKNAMFCPTFQEDVTDARTRSFRIKAGVAVIGGFRGNEKCRSERSFSPSPLTILSGDYLDTPEESGDDVYRVVVFDSIPPGQVARIEQLGIGYGNANHYINPVYQSGGGVVVTPGGRVVNCYIRKCLALQKGGGVYLAAQVGGSDGQRAMLSGSVVEKCEAGKGGGVYAGSWSVMTNNTIVGNKAVKGGGVDFDWPVAIQGTVIWGNEGDNGKNLSGVTRVAYMQGTDSLYPVNFCAVEGFRAEGNQNMALTPENEGAGRSPVFVDPENPLWFNGGLSLSVQSSLIDAGLNTSGVYTAFTAEELLKICALTDIDMAGNPRAHTYNVSNEGTFLDIGAYEAMGSVELVPDTRDRLYVTRRGRGRMDGSSWKHATSDLQAALDYFGKRMKKGEVWVQGGYTYIPMRRKKGETDRRAAFFILNPYVNLYGGFMGDTLEDAAAGRISESELEQRLHLDRNNNGVYEEYEFRYETVLDGGVNPTEGYSHNAYHVLYYEGGTVGDTVVVNGFTVQNGQSLCGSIGRFRSGGGLYAEGPVRVENCVFRNNFAVENGGALYAVAGGVVTGCLFGGNGVMLGRGGAVYLAGGLLANSLVTNNTSQGSGGGGVFLAGGGAVNCVIARNNNWTEGAGLLMRGGAVAVNTVVWGNAGGRQLTEVAGEGRLRFCALPDGRVSTGVVVENCIFLDEDNESADGPRFLRPTEEAVTEAYTWASDWRVHTLSPLTDAGDSTLYQVQRLPRELNYIAYAGSGGLTPVCRVRGRNIDVGYYENAPVELADCDTLYVRTWENPLQVADGSSWDRATSDLQAAIRKLEGRTGANRQIWVAQGNYAPTQLRGTATESRSFVIDRGGIAIYGGFPDDGVGTTRPDMEERNPERYITKLDGSCTRSAHVVYASKTESKTLIDGFTICGGNAAGTGTEGRGAALYVAGAAYQLYINHCVITDNEAVGEGAAVYSESQLAVTNSLVFRNRTSGLRSDYVRMVNNTFVANEGPGVQITGAATSSWGGVQNCVFWGNKGLQLYNRSGVVIDHCAVQDSLFAGVGNIRLNAENGADGGPRFRNPESVEMTGFRPDCGSVLADAGNEVYPSDIPMDHYDLSSRLRIMFSTIDIGAFESVKGKAPVRPEVGTEAVALCQGTTREVPVSNEVPDTKLYALYDTWEVLLTDKLVISGEHPGTQYYSVVRVDTTGCYSEADSIAVSVGMAVVPVGLSGTAEICAGEDAVLTFVPEAGHIYSLYDGGVEMRTGVTIGDGKLTVERPAVGEHHYSMQAAFGECVSERSAEVVVTVYEEGGITDGSALFPVSGTVLPGGCEGTEITDIVYRYEGAGGAEVTGLTAGLTVTLDKVAQTISIGGRVTEPVAYTVRTTGGGSTCSAARMTGVITVYPKPSFKFGKKK